MKSINQRLNELYNSKWFNLSSELQKIIENDKLTQKPTNPLLLKINENNYLSSDIKVLFFGQETNDWEDIFDNDITNLEQVYNDFYNSGNAFTNYNTAFFKGIASFKKLLEDKFSGKKVSVIWNNVIKIGAKGRNNNRPEDYIQSVELKSFNILEEELQILEPDVILFASGPNYDSDIEKKFQGIEFNDFDSNFTQRKLAKLKFKEYRNIYRSYHPRYLIERELIDEYYTAIVENIIIEPVVHLG